MKDRQVESVPMQTRIPVVSAVLHCVAMTAVVFLRSGFGYAYLRPKSIFFACSWAFALFCIYAWIEPGAWQHHAPICIFGMASMGLYWLHLSVAFVSQLRGSATHDNDSGTPHILRIVNHPRLQAAWVMWGEPVLLLAAALTCGLLGPAWKNLSTWFLTVSLCLGFKEFLNHWFRIRHEKIQGDNLDDAKENIVRNAGEEASDLPPPSRKPKAKYPRAS
jgi:hypothetical protein